MFYPQEMSKVRLIIPSRDLLSVTKELARQGVFHQTEGKQAVQKVAPAAGSWPEQAAAYATLERRITSLMRLLNLDEGVPQPADGETMIDATRVTPTLDQIEQEVNQVRDQLSREQKQLDMLHGYLSQLEPIADIDLDLDALRNPGYLYSIFGVLPVANIERLQTSLAKVPHVFVTLRQENQRSVVWLTGQKRDAAVLDRAARSAYLNPLNLPEVYQGTPAEIIRALRADITAAEERIRQQNAEIARLHDRYGQQLQALLWQVRASRVLADAIARYGQFRYTYVITGWVPTDKIGQFEDELKQVSNEIIVDTSAYKRAKGDEAVPVALHNPWFIRPFQAFVMNYARPQYAEIDPTFLLAVTFPLLFGAMFGDVGQGVILALLGQLLVSRRVKLLRGLAGLGGIITACGISAIIFGVLYGSVFGFEDIIRAILFRPSQNILTTMGVAIGIGMLVLSVGFIISILNSLTTRDWGHLFFTPHGLAGLLLYWSLIGIAVEGISGKVIIPIAVLGLIALVSVICIMFSEALIHLLEGHRPLVEGGFGIYVVQSFFELFEILISLLSNSISFVRVGAFAVAHVGLTTVMFILAKLVSPGMGVGYWLVVVIFNIFIIGFEGLIVGIQTMRLNYYEFFSKFFEGGGERYEPLTLTPKVEQ